MSELLTAAWGIYLGMGLPLGTAGAAFPFAAGLTGLFLSLAGIGGPIRRSVAWLLASAVVIWGVAVVPTLNFSANAPGLALATLFLLVPLFLQAAVLANLLSHAVRSSRSSIPPQSDG